MHSFAVVAGLVAAANAAVYGYPATNSTSAAPVYGASSTAPVYGATTPVSIGYTTKTVTGLTTVCPGPTTISVGTKTYTITKSTTLIDTGCVYTTTVPVKSVPAASSTPVKPAPPVVYSSAAPPAPVYPSKNGTAPTYAAPTGVAPSATKPAPSQFTGAAAQTGAAMLAIVGAVAAFL